ncbi:MAG: Hsp20/alpha crystallin family protein [Alphaproteobacteria bacterium]
MVDQMIAAESSRQPETTRTRPVAMALADIYETEDSLTVMVDMPGVATEGIDVTLDKHVLTINGRRVPGVPEGVALVQAEYREADYQRSFTLSEAVDKDRIEAVMRDGVLTLTLPKASPVPTRSISVRAG